MGTAAVVGVALAAVVLITLLLVWVTRRRDETPDERRRRARLDQEKSQRWLHGRSAGSGFGEGSSGGGGD